MRLAELAESEGINPTMLSRVIAELVEAGLLERDSDAGDRRAVWVNTTLSGKRLAERIRRERTDAVSLALGALSDDDQERPADTHDQGKHDTQPRSHEAMPQRTPHHVKSPPHEGGVCLLDARSAIGDGT